MKHPARLKWKVSRIILTQSGRGHGAAIKMGFEVGHVVSLLFVVECLTRDRGAASSSLTGVTASWSLSKTHLF